MLTAILDEYRYLPRIAWTVGTAGSTLVGRVGCGEPAGVVRMSFDSWCAALAVEEQTETPAGGGSHLSASVRTGGVKITLTALAVSEDEPNGGRA
jgi:hypothetical protein